MIDRSNLEADPVDVARHLLGCVLVSDIGPPTAIRLTEVEAYAPDDPASHSFGGRTERNQSMFERAGTLYVYRSYGIHWCANVSTGPVGTGAAVLLRGGVPIDGLLTMIERRGRQEHLADGPGKLCQALAIDRALDGVDLLDGTGLVRLEMGEPPVAITATPRIGISKAIDAPWRFMAQDA